MRAIRTTLTYLLLASVASILCQSGCANRVPLTGGPKDERPPVLDTLNSFKNEQIRFSKQRIDLYFDEFIELKNAAKQVVVSPPLNYLPVISGKGHRVIFDFGENELLKDNATYVINFGEAIVDYTEGNKLNNFTIVFSTGDYIDSLSMKGKLLDARTQGPVENYLIMLYESFEDSIVYQKKPFYFAKSSKDGTFQINNLRADTFKLFVLNDKNLDYLYDPQSEEIGFIDDLIIVSDTASIDLTVETFKEYTLPRFSAYEVKSKGQIELQFDQVPDLKTLSIIDSIPTEHIFQVLNDLAINLWYTDISASKLTLAYRRSEEIIDTISLRINQRSASELDTLVKVSLEKPKSSYGLHPDFPAVIVSSYPLGQLDPTRLIVVDTVTLDTLAVTVGKDSNTVNKVLIYHQWNEQSVLSLTMLPGFITDIWGHSHDTAQSYLNIAERIDFSTIALDIINIPPDTSYVVNLKEKEATIHQYLINGADTLLTISQLPPGEYTIEIIEDLNNNKKWDPGSYLMKRQSERIFEKIQLEKLKENRILDYEVDISALKNSPP